MLNNFLKAKLCVAALGVCLASCTVHRLPPFSSQQWHVDTYSGNAVGSSGLEFAFGSEWMITDTTLMQNPGQLARYPKLSSYLAKAIAQFDGIEVDSIYFYNPHRNLLFAAYHQTKPLKPTSEISLVDESEFVYSREYSRIFGKITTHIDDDGWENGPSGSVYSNVRYLPRNKQLVMLQRIPSGEKNIAVFQILTSIPKRGKWWEEYPRGTFANFDPGNPDNIEKISLIVQSWRNVAVSNLQLALPKNQ